MSTVSPPSSDQAERLTDAFRLFNELSQHLSTSYQSLRRQVEKLTSELASAQSDRVKTLMEKERLANRLQQIMAALPVGVVIVDGHDNIVDCNDHAGHFLGEPLLGQLWSTVWTRSLASASDMPCDHRLLDGRTVNRINNRLTDTGEQLILLTDVTPLRQLQDTVSRQRQLTAMGEMVAGLAHQIRTPLATAVLYASQLTKTGLTDDTRQQFSSKVLERLHHLERQIDDMLIFVRDGHGSSGVVSLNRLLDPVEEALLSHDIVGMLHRPAEDCRFSGNEDALRGVLINLIENAVEAEARRITIDVKRVGLVVTITISDDGSGIDAATQRNIFQPFFTTKANGTGLGLAVVDRVVRAHRGRIACESQPGGGTVFTLTLPVDDSERSARPTVDDDFDFTESNHATC